MTDNMAAIVISTELLRVLLGFPDTTQIHFVENTAAEQMIEQCIRLVVSDPALPKRYEGQRLAVINPVFQTAEGLRPELTSWGANEP